VSCPQVPVMMLTQKSNKKKEVWKSVGVLFPSTVWWESYHENGKRNSIWSYLKYQFGEHFNVHLFSDI
jgi:hypothetical protein